MSEIFSPLVYQLGIGGIGGFIVGYAVKKLSKLVAFVVGVFIIVIMYLGVKGIININWGKFFETLMGWLGFAGRAAEWFISLISMLPFIGSFVVGFLLGFKIG